MSIVHIITVGTSLLTNNGGQACRRDGNTAELNNFIKINLNNLRQVPNNFECFKKPIVCGLNKLNIDEEINFRGKSNTTCTDRLPQELSYLFLRQREPKACNGEKEEAVYLLPTDTNDSRLCAEVIKQYIAQSRIRDCYKVKNGDFKIRNIDADDGEEFSKKGIRNLFKVISGIIDEISNNGGAEKIYLNITGGYKAIVPYSTLQGMLYAEKNVEVCYLYENSAAIIPIPSYPIGLDFHLWSRNITRLRMVREGQSVFYEDLDDRIKHVVKDKELNALGKQLEARYEEQIKKDPLEIYAKEMIEKLLPKEPDTDANEYQNILNGIIEKAGVLIWTGDKIPEMVEHARHHHLHLLEFAEMFLTPIFDHAPEFLNPAERFCLLAGLLLHDCGHSLDYMDTDKYGRVPLFPSEIREYHHLLAVQRLEEKELAEGIGWPGSGRLNGLHEAVMNACRYHRKRMPYYEDLKESYINPFDGKGYGPIESKKEYYYRGLAIDIMKIVALMRIIDGCDNQARRVGDTNQIGITIKLLEQDHKTAYQRALEAYEVYRAIDSKGCGKKLFVIDSTSETINLHKGYMDFRIACLECIKDTTSHNKKKQIARMWLVTAELVDRAAMKHKQEEHYIKHQCVKEVMVYRDNDIKDKDTHCFNVVLCKNTDISDKFIEKEVSGEFYSVADYMTKNCKFNVNYWWEDDYNNRENGGNPFYPERKK